MPAPKAECPNPRCKHPYYRVVHTCALCETPHLDAECKACGWRFFVAVPLDARASVCESGVNEKRPNSDNHP